MMDEKERKDLEALDREIFRLCQLNEKRLEQFYQLRDQRVGDAAEIKAAVKARMTGALNVV